MLQLTQARFLRLLFCKRRFLFLAFLWFLGLVSGAYYANQASNSYFLLMRMAVQLRPSIVGLFLSNFFPFLLIYLWVRYLDPSSIYILWFLQSFSLAFLFECVQLLYGSATWLVRFLFLFSHVFSAPFLCWFLIRHISGAGPSFKKDAIILLIAVLIACLTEYFVVSPFLTALF